MLGEQSRHTYLCIQYSFIQYSSIGYFFLYGSLGPLQHGLNCVSWLPSLRANLLPMDSPEQSDDQATQSGESILLANTPEPLAAPSTGVITRSKHSKQPRKSYRTRSIPRRSACKTPNRRAKAASFSDTKSSRVEQNSPHSTDRDPDKLFVIDSLLKCKETKGSISYLVHWKGYP